MRPLLDILMDEKSLLDEIRSIEQALLRIEGPDEIDILEARLIDLQMELDEVLEEIQDYMRNTQK